MLFGPFLWVFCLVVLVVMEVGEVVVAERGRKGHSVVVYIAVVAGKEWFITVDGFT